MTMQYTAHSLRRTRTELVEALQATYASSRGRDLIFKKTEARGYAEGLQFPINSECGAEWKPLHVTPTATPEREPPTTRQRPVLSS
jgi:hypothetical protein